LIGEVLKEQNPIAVAVWATAEMQRLNEKSHSAEQSKSMEAVKTQEQAKPESMLEEIISQSRTTTTPTPDQQGKDLGGR
jgi:hypothetical protein